MKIALMNIEPKVNNTALMQISRYYKDNGDQVEWYIDFMRDGYDKVYCSSLFDFTNKTNIPQDVICGGTGFDLAKRLPPEIGKADLDYSIYPNCKTSYVWFSRGCIRNCPFCIVRQKEGYIHPVDPKKLNPNGNVIAIQDNNFFANPEWRKAEKYLDEWNQKIDFSSGIDVRIFKPKQAEFINKYKIKYIHIAWDNPKENLYNKIKYITKYISPFKILCYVLIGYWSTPEEDLMRVKKLHELKIRPYVMPYNKKDQYQRQFARYVNQKIAYYKRMTFEEYLQDTHEQNKYDNKQIGLDIEGI